ncbi:MAG: hypothetical protein QXK18_04635 [Candidatus Bathyarchaeia archaeon]
MGYPRIKEELLKSGLPLESMVAKSIDVISSELPRKLINHGEYFFERQSDAFPNSVDFIVTYDLDVDGCDFVQLVFAVECKYRTRGTGWYFAPNPVGDSGMEFFVENFFSKGKCNWKTFPSTIPPLNDTKIPIVGKGVEIYSNGQRNEKSINEGIHQLMFSTSSLLSRAFFSENLMLEVMLQKSGINLKGRSFHSLLCPIIVTTADIHFLKDLTIERIEQSEKLEDFSSSEKIVVYSTPNPPPYVKRYIMENVAKDITSMLPLNVSTRDLFDFLTRYSTFHPSRFYILNYRNFEDFIKKYIAFAETMLIYACRRTTKD